MSDDLTTPSASATSSGAPFPAIPSAPRLTGDAAWDTQALANWMNQMYRALALAEGGPTKRLERLAAVPDLDLAPGETPTAKDLEAVRDKLNDLLAAVRG